MWHKNNYYFFDSDADFRIFFGVPNGTGCIVSRQHGCFFKVISNKDLGLANAVLDKGHVPIDLVPHVYTVHILTSVVFN